MKQLIVNADDFGISAGVNRGIIEAHQRAIVTSTTVMINMPDAADGIRLAREQAPNLGLGLHINFSFGVPVSPADKVPSLVLPSGTFCSTFGQIISMAGQFTAEDVQTEIRAQMERFIQLVGRPPDHLDSHHNITYFHPAAFEMMLMFADEYHIPLRNGERPLAGEFPPGLSTNEDGKLVARLNDSCAAYAKLRWPQNHDPRFSFFGTGATFETLVGILTTLSDGITELMVHPGYANGLKEAYAAPREMELAILTDPRVCDVIEREGIQLVTFAAL
jgi:chitin disaccharide deacetylase